MSKIYDAIVIGGGPAGIMSSIVMASHGLSVIILDKNKLLGRKLRITGKGRCNITNTCDFSSFISNIPSGNKFLMSSLKRFSNLDLIDFFNELGLETKEERGGRVFPLSEKAYDVAECLVKRLSELKVPVLYDASVFKVTKCSEQNCPDFGLFEISANVTNSSRKLYSRTVLVATGGKSYKLTGSNGDGYKIATTFGHHIVDPKPSLIALRCKESDICKYLEGITLKNVGVTLVQDGKKVFDDFGEMLFTDKGITGPIVLSASRFTDFPTQSHYLFTIDLKKALSEDELKARIKSDFTKYGAKELVNAMTDLLPKRMIPVVLFKASIDERKVAKTLNDKEISAIVRTMKGLSFEIIDYDDPDHAVITRGGIVLDEINPKTMESKLISGLFFAGEVMDIDAFTGGYNLTLAFSTGHAAGEGISEYLSRT